MMMKSTAATRVSILLLIRSAISLPKYTARMETKVSAISVPESTIIGSYFVPNSPDAICVLSPHSANKIRTNPERNALL